MSEDTPRRPVIRVAGDLTAAHRLYDGTCDQPLKPGCPSTLALELGGAVVVAEILRRLQTDAPHTPLVLPYESIDSASSRLPQTYSLWARGRSAAGDASVWRQQRTLGTSAPNGHYYHYGVSTAAAQYADQRADVLVLDDENLGFRHAANAALWPAELAEDTTASSWIILRTLWPVAHGDLWRRLQTWPDRLIVVIEAEELRRGEVGITKGLSWERTAEELVRELTRNKEIADLRNCRHLVVTMGSEGALWREQTESGERFRLVFDPANLEGEWTGGVTGDVPGGVACLLAALAHELALTPTDEAPAGACAPDTGIAPAIMRGLRAARRLRLLGHSETYGAPESGADEHGPAFPYDQVAAVVGGARVPEAGADPHFGVADVPSLPQRDVLKAPWSILASGDNQEERPLFGMARLVALFGPRRGLGSAPYARFGKLLAVDRQEIESLRGLKRVMADYVADPRPPRPLCIAVFGAPGSGKSFGVKQIAKGLMGDNAPILEFNLSQLAGPEELIGAFHQVRDEALKGVTPVVFWDEFDSRQYAWLQYLLAPMQDGRFQEGQLSHPIGKCIFIFAGGTSQDFAHFGPSPADTWRDADGLTRSERFTLQKGPDFVSRLNGYLNIAGPNPRQLCKEHTDVWVTDETDITYPIRRALLLRSADGLYGDERLEIDDGLLSSFLLVSSYRHGARSLETIVRLTRDPRSGALHRSALPPREQLGLHVDPDEFTTLAERVLDFKMRGKELAPHVHEYYRELAHATGHAEKYDVDYGQLPASVREANIAAALRITSVLGYAGLELVHKEHVAALTPAELRAIIDAHIEKMAEAEHEGWMEDKYLEGWEHDAVRDDARRLHDCLVPYKELPEETREKDRNAVRHYPELIDKAGYAAAPAGAVTGATE